MPKWGLTAAMRKTKPWGLEEKWLQPGKVITDPVHGDIHLMYLEMALIDSRAFQRLRKVRQLGTTQLVYPGATHSRFAHSIGAVKVAQDLLDVVIDQRSGRDPQHDLFNDWEHELGLPEDETKIPDFDKRIAEVTILARVGALLHDLCHVPFGHSIEDDLKILTAHDANEARFDRLWATVREEVREAISADSTFESGVRRLVLSKAKGLPKPPHEFVEDIVGNTICADLLDYLRRDHLYTGLPLALGRRFESGYYVMRNGDVDYQRRMVLRVHRDREERSDAITEILKHLRYRYELSERALVHHTKVAADAMIGKALEMWRDALWVERASDVLAGDSGAEWPAGRNLRRVERAFRADGHDPDKLRDDVRDDLDELMTWRGDDGILEYLRELPEHRQPDVRHCDTARREVVAELASALEDRRLYKQIAIQHKTRRSHKRFWKKHGNAAKRRRLERRAKHFAGVDHAWKVLVWIPAPKMRLKVASVLVDDGTEILEFHEREKRGQGRGTDIYDAHRALWGVSVYVHPELKRGKKRDWILASLAADLNLQLGGLEERWGPSPHEWPERAALEELRVESEGALAKLEAELAERAGEIEKEYEEELRASEAQLGEQLACLSEENALADMISEQLSQRARGQEERPSLTELVERYRQALDDR